MLIACPECEKQVSDKAVMCPHCGIQLKRNVSILKSPKRMRLPNGFGRITKLKDKHLRKPYRAMVSLGKDEKGRPIGKLLKPVSYFETYNEAYEALMEYHKTPYDLEHDITLGELYEKWSAIHFEKVSVSRVRAIKSSWLGFDGLSSEKVQLLTSAQLRSYFASSTKPYTTKNTMAIILKQMLDYAIECGIVEKNVADIKGLAGEAPDREDPAHKPFTEEEIKVLLSRYQEIDVGDIILVNCYTGFRPNEILSLKVGDFDEKSWTLKGGMKTKAGKNRIVPVHKAIRGIVKKKISNRKNYKDEPLFTLDGKHIPMRSYHRHFTAAMEKLGMVGHKPHDCRKHFVTRAKKSGMDEYAIKRIVGHAISDITEAVYTERDANWLHEEMEKFTI